MPELLQKATSMPVVEVVDGARVIPNHVYVIPPKKDLGIFQGVLQLRPPNEKRGLRLPIDSFFSSLADDLQSHSIAILLSGMGSDGTLGLTAIKGRKGATFVQTPASAKFDAMPKSAIAAGVADFIAPAEDLGAAILVHTESSKETKEIELSPARLNEIEQITAILQAKTRQDFSLYKKSTLFRRIERRVAFHHLKSFPAYLQFLGENGEEADLLLKELLIGVTQFFRDPEIWDQLKAQVFPALFAMYPNGATLRAWVPACSTGEEAYTIGMAFLEALDEFKPKVHFGLQIFATDLDKGAVDKARAGVFSPGISKDVSSDRLDRFFSESNGRFRIKKEVREIIVFANQNIIMDPPFTMLDLLSCRNLLIYLESTLQNKLFPLFHYSLKEGGHLILGSAESLGPSAALFEPLSGKNRIFKKKMNVPSPGFIVFPTQAPLKTLEPRKPNPSFSDGEPNRSIETLLLNHISPPSVLTNAIGNIFYISGKTGKYLEPAAGRASLNLFTMARAGLETPLRVGVETALRSASSVLLKQVVFGINGGTITLNIEIERLRTPSALAGMMLVSFIELPSQTKGKKKNTRTLRASRAGNRNGDNELQEALNQLQLSREEMQSSQEELRSTNEELQSTNEELQSTNEELTTSKEEMQSMNEELQTVNRELQAKVDDLSEASDDITNLLNSTDIATLFLDSALVIRKFTPKATNLFKLIAGDVGRPLSDLVTELNYPQLSDDAKEVLRTLVFKQTEASTGNGALFRVRIMPYRTQNNHINGVVITFIER